MNSFRSLFNGILAALTSVVIVVGALSLALSEGSVLVQPPATAEQTEVAVTPSGDSTQLVEPVTAEPQVIFITATPFLATSCPVQSSWKTYTVRAGDTLQGLAAEYKTTAEKIKTANCMMIDSIMPGSVLFLPQVLVTITPAPTITKTANPAITLASCGPPYGWIYYVVKPGDTLFHISLMYGVDVYQLQTANCLYNTGIRVGEYLYVPNVPPRIVPTVAPPPTNPPAPTKVINTPVKTTQAPPTPVTPVATTAVPPTEVIPTTVVTTVAPPTEVLPTAVPPPTDVSPTVAVPPTVAAQTQPTVEENTPVVVPTQ